MMNKMCMAAIIAASLYAGTTFAQPAAVKKIIETGQTDNRVMHQLDILTNRFGGRVIGSDRGRSGDGFAFCHSILHFRY